MDALDRVIAKKKGFMYTQASLDTAKRLGRLAALREVGHAICEMYALGMTPSQMRESYMEIIDAMIAKEEAG